MKRTQGNGRGSGPKGPPYHRAIPAATLNLGLSARQYKIQPTRKKI